jgi:tyrosine-protein kinase Etk/Wzc
MPSRLDRPSSLYQSEQGISEPSDARIDFWAALLILALRRRLIFALTLGGMILGVVLSYVLKPTFTAEATILPPQQSVSTSSLMGQLGSIAGAASLGGGLGLKNPADMYIGMLQSRTIADHVISACDLAKVYKTKYLADTRAALKLHVTFETGKDNLIHLSVKDKDPNRASQIANSYLDQLYDLNSDLASSEAAQRRSFYERRLEDEKAALSEAEVAFRNVQQKTGVIQLSGQAASIISSIATARAQLASREVELQSMRTFATERNPDAIRVEEEISALRANLTSLENSQRAIQPGDVQLPAGQVPEAALQFERQARELKYHETLFDLLSRQSEAARLVVDRAVPPDKKSGPPRTLITIGLTFLGFLIACLWSFAAASLEKMKRDPEQAHKLRAIRSAFRA